VANEYFVGAINRVGREDLEDTEYYGSSYFASPRGQVIDGTASDTKDEVLVRDLDMGLIEEVRRQWAFYRDRRPEVYGEVSAL
jgi:N-carbamoylputrescine amidase